VGWGDVDLREQFSFEPRKGQAHPNAIEYGLVKVEEGNSIVGPLIPTDRLAWSTGKHNYIFTVAPSKGTMLIDL